MMIFRNPSTFGYGKGQQGNRSGPFHGKCQRPLVFGAISGDSPRHDLAPFGDEIPQGMGVLVVYLQIGIRAETAEFTPVKEFFLRP